MKRARSVVKVEGPQVVRSVHVAPGTPVPEIRLVPPAPPTPAPMDPELRAVILAQVAGNLDLGLATLTVAPPVTPEDCAELRDALRPLFDPLTILFGHPVTLEVYCHRPRGGELVVQVHGDRGALLLRRAIAVAA